MNAMPAQYPPANPGHYLVYQEHKDQYHRYRFVRYWNGVVWNNANEEKYGVVKYWSELPDWPK
jgi:hypothetical protein